MLLRPFFANIKALQTGLVIMMETTSSQATAQNVTHPGWYAIGFVSALIMGTSAYVIAYNFMIGQAPLLIVIACALAGFILNTSLYWLDSAQKLEAFFTKTLKDPRSLLHSDAIINFASAVCVGFLAMHAYLEQVHTVIPAHLHQIIPIWPLVTFFSIANAISTFVLFYEPEDHIEKKPTTRTIRTLFRWLKEQYNAPRQTKIANIIGISQSLMYSLTNLWCVQSVIHLIVPQLSTISLIFSVPMSLALLYAECKFNCEKMQKIFQIDAPKYWSIPLLQSSLYALVVLNGFANGWIALGDLRHLPWALKYLVVGIGSTVSFAVMKSNLKDINMIIFNPIENQHRLIPVAMSDKAKLVEIIAKSFILSIGVYIECFPAVWQQFLAAAPVIAYPLVVGIVFTTATCAIDAFLHIQNTINNQQLQFGKTHTDNIKSANLGKPELPPNTNDSTPRLVNTLISIFNPLSWRRDQGASNSDISLR